MDNGKRTNESNNECAVAVSKTTEKILDDSQYTGELLLSAKKLKDLPSTVINYDLSDLYFVDLSWNILSEIPHFLINFLSLEHLNCHHNFIKYIPLDITVFEHLVVLDLSHNLLTSYPSHACHFKYLQVLNLSSNKITFLPEEINLLRSLMELNLSKNSLSELPNAIGALHSLRHLNLRHNQLTSLNPVITGLHLVKLDVSVNKITRIPLELHLMASLDDLNISNNPIALPPQHVVLKGKQHIMAFLASEQLKRERMKSFKGIYKHKMHRNGLSASTTVLRSCSQDGQHLNKQLSDSSYTEMKKPSKAKKYKNKTYSTDSMNDDKKISSCMSVDDLMSRRRCLEDDDNDDAAESGLECSSDSEIVDCDPQSPPTSFTSTETLSFHESPRSSPTCLDEHVSFNGQVSKLNGLDDNHLKFYDIGFIVEGKRSKDSLLEESSSLSDSNEFTNSEFYKRHSKLSNQRKEEAAKIIKLLAEDPKPMVEANAALSPKLKHFLESMQDEFSNQDPLLTIRRNMNQFTHEKEQVKSLKKVLKALLKREFEEDIRDSLRDGTLLCELANQILPNSVPCVYTATSNEKLPEAKCRKNVENFLKVCRKAGLSQEDIYEFENILERLNKDGSRPYATLKKSISEYESQKWDTLDQAREPLRHPPSLGDHVIATFCFLFFVSTCLGLYLYPLPL